MTNPTDSAAYLYQNAKRELQFVEFDNRNARSVWARSMPGWTETPLYAASYGDQREAAERERVIEWISNLSGDQFPTCTAREILDVLATSIERGEHMKGGGDE